MEVLGRQGFPPLSKLLSFPFFFSFPIHSLIRITRVSRILITDARVSMVAIAFINVFVNFDIIPARTVIIRIIALSALHRFIHVVLRETDFLGLHLLVFPGLQKLISIIPLLIDEIEHSLLRLLILRLFNHPRDLLRRMVLLSSRLRSYSVDDVHSGEQKQRQHRLRTLQSINQIGMLDELLPELLDLLDGVFLAVLFVLLFGEIHVLGREELEPPTLNPRLLSNSREVRALIRFTKKNRMGKERSDATTDAVEFAMSVAEITFSAQRTVSNSETGCDEESEKTFSRTSSTPMKAKTAM